MPPYQFGAYIAWLGDKYYFFGKGGGVDLQDKAGPFTGVDEELNTKLYELLRRRD